MKKRCCDIKKEFVVYFSKKILQVQPVLEVVVLAVYFSFLTYSGHFRNCPETTNFENCLAALWCCCHLLVKRIIALLFFLLYFLLVLHSQIGWLRDTFHCKFYWCIWGINVNLKSWLKSLATVNSHMYTHAYLLISSPTKTPDCNFPVKLIDNLRGSNTFATLKYLMDPILW